MRFALLSTLAVAGSSTFISSQPLLAARRAASTAAVNVSPVIAFGRAPSLEMLSAPEIIDAAVRFDTFAPQFLWLLIIAVPRSGLTERVMGPIAPVLGLSLVHLIIVILAASAPGGTEPVKIFADVFDPSQSQLDGMVRLFEVRDFVAEEWPHVLIWDLFVGRAIWLDSLERGTPFTWAALALTNGIGPPGLLLYTLLCLVSGRGLPSLGYDGDAQRK